jgi:hypothetical protein
MQVAHPRQNDGIPWHSAHLVQDLTHNLLDRHTAGFGLKVEHDAVPKDGDRNGSHIVFRGHLIPV